MSKNVSSVNKYETTVAFLRQCRYFFKLKSIDHRKEFFKGLIDHYMNPTKLAMAYSKLTSAIPFWFPSDHFS
ncbi:hypothetical protein SPOG_05287 [Schizosaccharomyces cryophilus OY26]|uniref:Uncharacterized protein n=1 Tax=Schizosaccharomyces cryophilus (strain OY26 / ATCC MYA-4695 / CBS 11777 / NBRC 106824 / NRRL Y48691) TaxID=653667 RepID=S9W282_SCHCR|nr:uncharacterized protein SPOG_05287 [Schizosaccharomyces cryophilus OY26]EPY52474.1 hypothetical protein SPOG_05287 [Schizosaccharomyces cryophilus OY26]